MTLAQLERRTLTLGTEALYRDPALYEQLYLQRRDDVRFYVEQALREGGPILEIGAGSGRITLALAEGGYSVVGVDTMPPMLAFARKRLARLPIAQRERVTLIRADVRKLELGRRFPLVIAPFNVLQHVYTTADLELALRACAAHLAPGGALVFDVLMPDIAALAQDPDRIYRIGGFRHPMTKISYTLRESCHYDPATQIRTTHMFFEPRAPTLPALVVPLAQRQIFPAEIELLMNAVGLEITTRLGDFPDQPWDATARSQIVIARARTRLARKQPARSR